MTVPGGQEQDAVLSAEEVEAMTADGSLGAEWIRLVPWSDSRTELARQLNALTRSHEALRVRADQAEQLARDTRYIGDNHHNAAQCPHCGDLLGKARDALVRVLTWAEAPEDEDTALVEIRRITRQALSPLAAADATQERNG